MPFARRENAQLRIGNPYPCQRKHISFTRTGDNIPLRSLPKSLLYPSLSHPTEGRIAIVTDAGRDVVDAAALLTNSA
jgi:hypothetical protein